MRPIATDRVAWSIGPSVTTVSLATAADLIVMQFGTLTPVDPGNHVLDGVQIPHVKRQF